MSDEDDDAAEEDGDDGEDGEGGKKKGLSGKKLVLLVVLPLLLIIGGAAAAFFLGVFESGEPEMVEEEGAPEVQQQVVFYDLPEMLVNLNTRGNQTSYLKIRVSLEIDDPLAVERLDALQPRIVDNFQVYLRELRAEYLSGSAGVYRLKEELLTRVNAAVAPVRVNDVLFREMLVQ